MNTTKVLLVDDEPKVLRALNLRLGSDYKVTISSNPEEALTIAREKGPFPVVLSDLRMPKMNGLQFLESIEQISPETSRILLTGQGVYEDAVEALNSGKVFKYLAKPCDKLEIIKALEEGVINFENAVARKEALREYGKENKVAQIMQEQLLFSELPYKNEKIDFSAHSSPKRLVGGDFFEMIPYDEDCFDIVLADVMGKGLPAALIGAAMKHVFVRQSQRISAFKQSRPELVEILKAVEGEM